MEDRLRFIEHGGKRILLLDFTHCKKKEMLLLMNDIRGTVAEQSKDSLLALADFTEAEVDKEVATRIKEVLVFDRPYVKRSAWVGTESLPRVFYENFKAFSRRDFPTFTTREEALEWLARD